MAKIKKFTKKAARNRERVRKYRKYKKVKETYERDVREFYSNEEYDKQSDDMDEQPEDNCSAEFDIREDLKFWAIKHRITKRAINDLLAILFLAGFTCFPKDSRTILETPTNVNIQPLSSGKLWYYGIQKNLDKILEKCNRDLAIHLDYNFDGLPLFESSVLQFFVQFEVQYTPNLFI